MNKYYIWTEDGDCSNACSTLEEARWIVELFSKEDGRKAYITNEDNEIVE